MALRHQIPIVVTAFLCPVGLFAENASATEYDGDCNVYAQEAVDSQMKNIEMKCGFTGPRWHTNYRQHYDWCDSSDKNTRDFERTERDYDIQDCDDKIVAKWKAAQARKKEIADQAAAEANDAHVSFCQDYSANAIAAYRESENAKCGYNWESNYDAHFDWCLHHNEDEAKSDEAGRNSELKTCALKNANQKETGTIATCLFTDSNFGGVSKCLTRTGNFEINVARQNQYSSIRVTNGFRVLLFTGPNQTGVKCTYDEDFAQFGPKCNDVAKSVMVLRK